MTITTATVTTITAPRLPVPRDTTVALLTWAPAAPAARVDLPQALTVTHLQALAALAVWVLVITGDPIVVLEAPMEDHPVASEGIMGDRMVGLEGIMEDTTEDLMVVLTEAVQVARDQ